MIKEILDHGAVNAITAKELAVQLMLPGEREVVRQIQKERLEGAVILSDTSGGYYLPSHDRKRAIDELQHFISTRKKRIQSEAEIMKSAAAELTRMTNDIGQFTIGDSLLVGSEGIKENSKEISKEISKEKQEAPSFVRLWIEDEEQQGKE